ncbi:hypothetical protein BH24ACI4_BH24ACI4_34560 [soil metagenome]
MMKPLPPPIVSGVALAIVVTLALTPALMAAGEPRGVQSPPLELAQGSPDELTPEESRDAHDRARQLEGVWEAHVTRRACDTGDPIGTFRGMTNFIRGGSLVGTNSNPNPPTTYGRWQHLGGRRYIAVERFFRYADGTFAGVQRITRNILLSREGNQFTGVNTSEAFDLDGNLIRTGCTTDISYRVE